MAADLARGVVMIESQVSRMIHFDFTLWTRSDYGIYLA